MYIYNIASVKTFAKSCALRSFWAFVYQSRGIYITSLFRSVLFMISILYG